VSGAHSNSLANLRRYPDTDQLEHLKPWQAVAIVQHELYGMTWKQVAEPLGKSENYLCALGNSPAGQRLRQYVTDMCDQPEAIALMLMKAATVNFTADYMTAIQWAKDAKDYAVLHRMLKDALVLAGAEDRKNEKATGKVEYHIHLDGGTLDEPKVLTKHEVLEAEVVDDD